jgi:hypothetical protein
MWVRFVRAFDFAPEADRRVTVAYPVGTFNVTRECGDRALALGAAVRLQAPKRGPDADAKTECADQVSAPIDGD